MTPVRSKRGKLTHVSDDLRKTICGRPCDGWLLTGQRVKELTEQESCTICHEAATTN